MIQKNINSATYKELNEIISTSSLIDSQFVGREVNELETLSLEIIEYFGEEYLEELINTTVGPTIFDARFWGKECWDIPHVDAEGQDLIETCCTRYVFWIGFGTTCSF